MVKQEALIMQIADMLADYETCEPSEERDFFFKIMNAVRALRSN